MAAQLENDIADSFKSGCSIMWISSAENKPRDYIEEVIRKVMVEREQQDE